MSAAVVSLACVTATAIAKTDDELEDELADELEQLRLPGVAGAGPLDMRIGRGRPSSAVFRMRSIALPLAGQLELDRKVWLLVEADVDDVGVRNQRSGRNVTARVRRHVATPLSVRVLDSDELAELGVEIDQG